MNVVYMVLKGDLETIDQILGVCASKEAARAIACEEMDQIRDVDPGYIFTECKDDEWRSGTRGEAWIRVDQWEVET